MSVAAAWLLLAVAARGYHGPSLSKLAHEAGVPVDNEMLDKLLHDRAYKSDLIHPNAAGHRRLAEAIADLLHRTGAV